MFVCELTFPDSSIVPFNTEILTPRDERIIFDQVRPRYSRSLKPKEFNFKQLMNGVGFDMDKFNRLVILRTVKGWSGLRNKHLTILYDKEKQWKLYGDGEDETEIPFSVERRRELAEVRSEFFMKWLDRSFTLIKAKIQKPDFDFSGTGFTWGDK